MDVWLAEILALVGPWLPVVAWVLPLPAVLPVNVFAVLSYIAASFLVGVVGDPGVQTVWLGVAWVDLASSVLTFLVSLYRVGVELRRRRLSLREPPGFPV